MNWILLSPPPLFSDPDTPQNLELALYNLFREKFKFRGFTKAFLRISRNILLVLSSRNLNISRNKLYIWNLQITRFKMIYDVFVF